MADPPKSKRKAKDEAFLASQRLMRDRPEVNESWKLIVAEWIGTGDEFTPTGTPDRTLAIVLSAVVEHSLERAILTHFVVPEAEGKAIFQGRNEEEAPLSSFAAKIGIGYALGVYDGLLKNDLRWIKNIRNAFAHTGRHLDFETPEIRAMVNALRLPTVVSWGGTLGFKPTTPRDTFASTARLAFLYLDVDLPEEPKPKRFETSEWYHLVFLGKLPKSSP